MHGYPLSFTLSPGQHADSTYFVETLDQVRLPGRRGRPIKRCRNVIADKGYDSEALRQHCDRYRMRPTIVQRSMHRRPRAFDRSQYRKRNVIERCFSWLKEKRRLCTSFKAMVTLACIELCLRANFSDRT
jgi:transposase